MKQAIVVNESLKLPRGKLAAQVAHAAVAAFLEATQETQQEWLVCGMPKIVLEGHSAEELQKLEEAARQRGIPVARIIDAGRTVVTAGTATCLGLGPARVEELNNLTAELRLVR